MVYFNSRVLRAMDAAEVLLATSFCVAAIGMVFIFGVTVGLVSAMIPGIH